MTRTAAALVVSACAALSACRQPEPMAPAPVFSAPVRVNDLDGGAGQSEPAIAASPDGSRLVAGWIDWSRRAPHVRLAVSSNGGASFGASRPVLDPDPAHARGQAEASIAYGGSRFGFAWIGCREDAESVFGYACDVYARTSMDGGRTWTAPLAIAQGGPVRRDRPWIVADGTRFVVSWSEAGAHGSRWKLARESADGASWEEISSLDGRTSLVPAWPVAGGYDALLVDRTTLDPDAMTLEWRRVTSAPANGRRFSFSPQAALFEYSAGAFAARRDGEAWIALPEGTGLGNDLVLLRRAAGGEGTFERTGIRMRSGRTRVGLPWLVPLGEPDARFLAAWLDEEPSGWRVRARCLGPGGSSSEAADVSHAATRFHEASLTQNIGDFLGAASASGAFWIVWSDTRDGDADVWIARGE